MALVKASHSSVSEELLLFVYTLWLFIGIEVQLYLFSSCLFRQNILCRGTALPSPCIIYYPPWLDGFTEVKTACLGLRSVRNYATPFHNFYKIVPLRSVPHNQAKPTANPLPQAEKTKNVS